MTTGQATKPVASFVLSLIAGVLILGGGVVMFGFLAPPYYNGVMGGYNGGMMGGFYGMMRGFGGWFYGFSVIGIVSGILVLLGALMLYSQPRQATAWGAVILAFSIVSFFGMAGFIVGAILGVVGGILALAWKQPGQV